MAPELVAIIIVALASPFALLPESISPRFVPWLLLLTYVKQLDATSVLLNRLRFLLFWLALSCLVALALAQVIDELMLVLAAFAERMIVPAADASSRTALANQLFGTRLFVIPILVAASYGTIVRHIKCQVVSEDCLHSMLDNAALAADILPTVEATLFAPHAAIPQPTTKPPFVARLLAPFKRLATRILRYCHAPFNFEFELWLRHAMAELLFARFGEKNVLKALLCDSYLVGAVRKTNDEGIVEDSLALLQTGTRTAIHKRASQLLIDVFATKIGYHVLQDYIERHLKSTYAQTIAGNSAPSRRPRRTHVIGVRVEYQVVGNRHLREAELVNVSQSGDHETGLFLGTGTRQFLSQRPVCVVRPDPIKTTVEFIHREAQVMHHRIISGWGVRMHPAASHARSHELHRADDGADAWQHIVL